MSRSDPGRWLDPDSGLSDAVREALRRASVEGPSPAQLERLVARFDLAGPAAPAAAQAARAMHAPAGAMWLGVSVLLALAIASVALRSQPSPSPRLASHAQPIAPAKQVAEPRAEASTPASPLVAASVPAPPAPAVARAAQVPPHADDIGAELALLERARRALAVDAPRARALLREHARRFPNGAFVEEREALGIEVLLRQGHAVEAGARARAFRERFPRSAYLRRIEALLEASGK